MCALLDGLFGLCNQVFTLTLTTGGLAMSHTALSIVFGLVEATEFFYYTSPLSLCKLLSEAELIQFLNHLDK